MINECNTGYTIGKKWKSEENIGTKCAASYVPVGRMRKIHRQRRDESSRQKNKKN